MTDTTATTTQTTIGTDGSDEPGQNDAVTESAPRANINQIKHLTYPESLRAAEDAGGEGGGGGGGSSGRSYIHTVSIEILSNSYGDQGGGSFDTGDTGGGDTGGDSGNANGSASAEGGGGGGADGDAGLVANTINSAVDALAPFAPNQITSSTIDLIMTNSPENRVSAQWDAADMGLLGAAMEAFRKGQDVAQTLAGIAKQEGGEYAARQLIRLGNISKQLIGGAGATDLAEAFTRKVENPFKEQLFKTMNFRSLPMQFKFAPANAGELATVDQIIKELEKAMHPEKTPAFLIYPSEFKITFRYKGGENPYLFKMNTCVLTDMKVDYGHNGFMTSFEGGGPTEITLTLNFKEIVLRDRSDY